MPTPKPTPGVIGRPSLVTRNEPSGIQLGDLSAALVTMRRGLLAGVCGLGLGVASLGGLSGCAVGWAEWPGVEGQTAFADPNRPAVRRAIVAALADAIEWRPPESGLAAIHLPSEMNDDQVERVFVQLGNRLREAFPTGQAPSIELASPNLRTPAVYHVSRVAIRVNNAEVDIVREAGTDDRGAREVGVTVRLQAGGTATSYVVEEREPRPAGVLPIPAYDRDLPPGSTSGDEG